MHAVMQETLCKVTHPSIWGFSPKKSGMRSKVTYFYRVSQSERLKCVIRNCYKVGVTVQFQTESH
jgi:hypothetical protein